VLKARIPPSWTLKHGTTPMDTVWPHVSISWWQQCFRTVFAYLLVIVLVLGFTVPVAFIGSLSQITYLTEVAAWLRWIGNIPNWIVATIQGVFPPVLLAILTATVPLAIRQIANMEGLYSRQATERHVQIYYFVFIFVQGFLTISLSAGITTIMGELTVTAQAVPVVLAQNLPKASNYFFSYIIISTSTTIISTLVRLKQLFNGLILSPLIDKTARMKWMRGESVDLREWGTFIPFFTNIACIGGFFSQRLLKLHCSQLRPHIFCDRPFNPNIQHPLFRGAPYVVSGIPSKTHRAESWYRRSILSYCNTPTVYGYLLHGVMFNWLILPCPRRK